MQVNAFTVMVRLNGAPESVSRVWTHVAANRWTETYPDGSVFSYDVSGRSMLNDCPGTVLKDAVDQSVRFVPDKGCPNMAFYMNTGTTWGHVGAMTNVK